VQAAHSKRRRLDRLRDITEGDAIEFYNWLRKAKSKAVKGERIRQPGRDALTHHNSSIKRSAEPRALK